ncbi:TetR/AcrR family transcriptional regulator [Henriciella sp.]|uniref:TetR/AcrR family transcriptional regulator n=1 Tax=Henriciella sp. TaxID=1968823 RepID=UPI002623853A|nr:TetR/AcrR family transcriptional regulator [Henriciella sp.]
MSNEEQRAATHTRILQAAREIVDTDGEEAATMKAVAEFAGVSRQTLYLHFSDRADMIAALADHIDETAGLGGWLEAISGESDGYQRLHRLAEMRFERAWALRTVVRAVESARHRDQAAAEAWRQRFRQNVNDLSNLVVDRLRAEGRVHASWQTPQAASLLVVLFSFRAWDDLTHDANWSREVYIETLTAAAASMLAGPSTMSGDLTND